ncbi:methyl-accepting chemotaxis sensory transducer [Candidatus Thiomargarita nelsonii]|uniref:Methyl-accepting chemotaxis sensory transducer n=1 Tax=Candidatus Thiomargarita nelsonii TaxID=1003181 RepID=A0A176RVB8_9GAMM|nr:methyl-accepting chemotaxis sensory transducer [Candidatus Thiomargarita nelsonii]
MSTPFFLKRLNDHIQYLRKIEATLAGTGDFQDTDHHDCQLGQWLYGDGPNQVAALQNSKVQEIFDSIFEPHEHFHTISKQILEKKQGGDEPAAQNAMMDMYRISHILTQKLLKLDTLTKGE